MSVVTTASLRELNRLDGDAFVAICGPLFEHSPWIAQRTWPRRPFASLDELHRALCATMYTASTQEQVKLIAAHPDLVGRLARQGQLTRESSGEQATAGLTALSPGDIAVFDRYNLAYRERFGFPFVICARQNKKDAILAAFPLRLMNTREQEIATSLGEIAKIAHLRLLDRLSEP